MCEANIFGGSFAQPAGRRNRPGARHPMLPVPVLPVPVQPLKDIA